MRKSRKDEDLDFLGILDSILHDDVERFKMIMSHAVSPDIYFNTNKFKIPKIISGFPTIISLSTFYSAVKCSYALAEMKPKFDKTDKYGRSSLHFAAAGGNVELIQLVAPKPEHYNKFDNNGDHAIIYSSMFNRLEATKYLSQYTDTEINQRALLTATKFGHIDIIKFFIEELNIDPDQPGIINAACSSGDVNIVDYFFKLGVRLDKNDEKGFPPIIDAISRGSLNVVKYLIAKSVDYVRYQDDFVPIVEAAACGTRDILKYLIKLKVDVNSRNSHGATPLYAALKTKNIDCAHLLLDNNADISEIHDIAIIAAETGDYSIMKRIIEIIGRDSQELKNKKLLITVLNSGSFENLQILIENGLEITAQDAVFFNLAEKAIANQCPQALRKLFEAGEEVQKEKGLFRFVLSKIAEFGATKELVECAALIAETGTNIYSGMAKTEMYFKLFEIDSPELYDVFVKYRSEFDIQKLINLNRTATWEKLLNIGGKPLKLLPYFVSNLMDINEKNEDGLSILHYAISKNCPNETFKYLISLGADVNNLSSVHTSPLLAACYAKLYVLGYYLLVNGANSSIKGAVNELPAEICAKNDDALFLLMQIAKCGGDIGNSFNIAVQNKCWITCITLAENGYGDKSSSYYTRIIDSTTNGKTLDQIVESLERGPTFIDQVFKIFNVCN